MSEWRARNTVATVICNARDEYLLVEEMIGGKCVFNQPAGHLEAHESLMEAAVRETREETGWQITLTGFLGWYVLRHEPSGEAWHRCCFAARADQRVSLTLDDGIIAAHWVAASRILSGELALRSPLVSQAVSDHRQGRLYPLELVHETVVNTP